MAERSGESLPRSIIDTGHGDLIVVEHLEAIVRAHDEGRRPAWGPDGHDWAWWVYHLAKHVLAERAEQGGECPFCGHVPRLVGTPPRLVKHSIDNGTCQGSGYEPTGYSGRTEATS